MPDNPDEQFDGYPDREISPEEIYELRRRRGQRYEELNILMSNSGYGSDRETVEQLYLANVMKYLELNRPNLAEEEITAILDQVRAKLFGESIPTYGEY